MTSPPILTGQVTAADVLTEIGAARRDITTVLTKVEVLDDRYGRVLAQLGDHETRIRLLDDEMPKQLATRLLALERFQWKALGALVVVGIVVGVVAGWLGSLLTHIH